MLCDELTSLSLASEQKQQPQPQQQQQVHPQQSLEQQQQHSVAECVLPRTSTEAMYSTAAAGAADEGMEDEVCFLMDHVEVSRCDPAAPNPQGPILPYIL